MIRNSNCLRFLGPVGIAAAAAIATAKKRKRPHSFETNPSIRKRQQTRLLRLGSQQLLTFFANVCVCSFGVCRKLKQTIDEYTTRVGQQAVVLIVTPGKTQNNFKVFGARPLENVVCAKLDNASLELTIKNFYYRFVNFGH